MALHQASGRWRFGLMLALVTAGCWATLPIALKYTLETLDVYTLTWFRFVVALFGVGAWLVLRKGLGGFRGLGGRHWLLLGVAAVMLIGNYVFYLAGLDYTTPATAQLLIQLAPLLMAVGGVIVFRERFGALQWLGLIALTAGLWFFYRDQLVAQGGGPDFVKGCLILVLGAVVWAVYALAQKQLLDRLSSPAILLFIYAVASVLLLPLASPAKLALLDGAHWIALLYCAFNTLAAYGAFAEALAHWEASRVSVVLAVTPLLTLLTVHVVHAFAPNLVAAERLGWIGWTGAALVVAGSALASLAGERRKKP